MKTQPSSIVEQVKAFIREPYAWPGGYPLAMLMNDGEAVCSDCAKENLCTILGSTIDRTGDGWEVTDVFINWEDTELVCAHCNQPIQSAY